MTICQCVCPLTSLCTRSIRQWDLFKSHSFCILDLFYATTTIVRNTSCYSTDSKRLHHCCMRLEISTAQWIFPTVYNRPGYVPQISPSRFSPGDLGLTKFMVPWAHPSPHPKSISTGSAVLAQITVVTTRHAHRDTPTTLHL